MIELVADRRRVILLREQHRGPGMLFAYGRTHISTLARLDDKRMSRHLRDAPALATAPDMRSIASVLRFIVKCRAGDLTELGHDVGPALDVLAELAIEEVEILDGLR